MVTKKNIVMRKAQALIELTLGLFALSLVLASLFAFLFYIVTSMNMSRDVRAEAGKAAMGSQGYEGSYSSASKRESISVSPMAAEYIFGSTQVEVKEEVFIPNMGIVK